MYVCFGAFTAMSIDLPKWSQLSTFTALHVHMLRSHGRLANRLAQVVTAVPRLRRVMYTLFRAVVALPIDVFKCSYSFNAYGDVMPIRFGAIDARSIYLLKCS